MEKIVKSVDVEKNDGFNLLKPFFSFYVQFLKLLI